MVDPFVFTHVRRLPLFAYLSPEQVEVVASAFQQMRCMPGDRLYRQGEVSAALYIFVSGGGRILRMWPDGIEREQGDMRSGEALGEETLFVNDRHDTSLLITQESIILVLTRARLEAVFSSRPDIRAVLNVPKNLMGNVQAQQQHSIRADEVVLLMTRRHPWAFAGRALIGTVLFAVLLALAFVSTRITPPIPILPLVLVGLAISLPVLMGIVYFFDWRNDYFVVTNQRVIHEERNLLTTAERREQALLANIQNVNVSRRGVISELVGFGDVVVNTAGNQAPLVLDMIPAPMQVQHVIFDQIQRRREQGAADNRGAIRDQVDSLLASGASSANAQPLPPPLPGSGYQPSQANALVRAFRALFPVSRTVEGDRITYRKHKIILVSNIWKPTLAYLLLGVIVGVRLSGRFALLQSVPTVIFLGAALLWLLLDTLWWYWGYIDWRDDIYILDSASIIDIKRRPLWLNETRIQAGLQQIQNVTSQIGGVWQQMFSFGDVIIQTAAEHGSMRFRQVSRPNRVAEEILQRVQRHAEVKNLSEQDDQRRLVEEYLSAYHQAARNGTPAQQPPASVPTPPPAPSSSPPPSIPTAPNVPSRAPVDRTQPVRPPHVVNDSSSSPTISMKPVTPPQTTEPPPNLDETQARNVDSDTQRTTPPKPPTAAP